MNRFRHRTYRRIVMTVLLLAGLLSLSQALFACETMDGKPQTVSCCDEPGVRNGDTAADCEEPPEPHVSISDDCCAVSSVAVARATNGVRTTAKTQVLLQDAPQPPPVAYTDRHLAIARQPVYFSDLFSPLQTGTNTYLLTHRLRI